LTAWYFDGTQDLDIGPIDSVHAAVSGGAVASSNTITAMNTSTGLVAAYATRVAGTVTGSASLGQDAYIYDPTKQKEYFVDPNNESQGTTNYELSYIGTIGDNGVAVGYYNTYSGTSSTVLSSNLFVWNETTGLPQVLASYSGSAAASSMNAYVSSFEFGPDGTLYGPNTYTGATSIVAYSVAVPEPTTLGVLGIGSLGLLRRRRRLVSAN
jgi:hypothetical protein